MKKKYIKPIIEYEELDNECPFLTNSHTEGYAIDGNPPIGIKKEESDSTAWGESDGDGGYGGFIDPD